MTIKTIWIVFCWASLSWMLIESCQLITGSIVSVQSSDASDGSRNDQPVTGGMWRVRWQGGGHTTQLQVRFNSHFDEYYSNKAHKRLAHSNIFRVYRPNWGWKLWVVVCFRPQFTSSVLRLLKLWSAERWVLELGTASIFTNYHSYHLSADHSFINL